MAIVEVMMQEQDKRAVESMCRCGLDIDGVIALFPKFSREDIVLIYEATKGVAGGENCISINCS